MCGRFAITLPPDAMAQLFAAVPGNDLPEVPNYNVCPTNRVHAIVSGQDPDGDNTQERGRGRRLTAMRWGFLPHWAKAENDGPLLINARAETIAEKPAFRAAVRDRRCLIPATGFYEWTKDAAGNRLPWYIHARDGAPLALAGVWQEWGRDDPKATCAIVTVAANESMSRIHHRMPLVLAPDDWPLWLGEAGKGAAALMRASPEDALAFRRVDPAVNSNRAAGPHLIDALA